MSWMAAMPIVAAVRASGVGGLPEGDRALFEPGGLILLEVLGHHGRSLWQALQVSAAGALVASLLYVAPLTLLLVGLAEPGKMRSAVHGVRAIEVLPTILQLSAVSWLLQLGFLFLGGVLGAATAALVESAAPVAYEVAWLFWLVCTVLFCACVRVLADAARVVAVVNRLRLGRALQGAWHAFRENWRKVASRASVYTCLGVSAVGLAALGTTLLDVSQPGTWRVVCTFGVHQLTIITLVTLRAGWLDFLTSLVSSSLPTPDGTRAGSDATGGPSPDLVASSV
jgi:hypothetical protein